MVWLATVAFGADPVDRALGVELGGTTLAEAERLLGKPRESAFGDIPTMTTTLWYDGGAVPGGGKATERRYEFAPAPGPDDLLVSVTWTAVGAVGPGGLRALLGPPSRREGDGRAWCDIPGHPELIVAAGVRDKRVVEVVAMSAEGMRPQHRERFCGGGPDDGRKRR
jgi:hypothetical protein